MIRRHLIPLAAWSAVCAAFFAPLLLQVARLPNGDFGAQFHSFALFQAGEMAAGRLPLWSPGSYGGFPFAADTQLAVFYLPRWITVLLSLPWGLSYYALELEAIAHVWLTGVFTYFLAHDLTRDRWAQLLGAIAFGLGGYLVSYPIQQLAILETIAWLPLVLLLLRRAFRPGARPVIWLVSAAVVLGLSLLAGHPQTFLQMSYLAAAYYLFLAWQARWRWPWALGLGLLVAAVAIGVSAVAWLPAIRYAAETTRTATDYAFVASGFPLLDYLQALVPDVLTAWSPQYVGLAAVFFAVLAWMNRRAAGSRARAELVFWIVAALIAAWLSLGDKGILFQLAYKIAPGASLFRQQERWVGVFSLSTALIAAQGLAIWRRSLGINRGTAIAALRRTAVIVVLLLVVSGVMLAAAQTVADTGWWTTWIRQWVILALLLITVALPLVRHRDSTRWRQILPVAAVVVLLAADLFLSTRPTMGLVAESSAVFWPQPDWMTALQEDSPGRIDTQNLFVANVGESYGLEDIRGISPLKPAVVEAYEQLPRSLRWRLLNVTHVIAPEMLEPDLSPVAPITESIMPGEPAAATLFRVTDPRPRAWAVSEVLTADTDEAALTLLAQPGFDPARQAVLTGVDPASLPVVSGDLPAAVSAERTARGLQLTVDAEAPTLVVISEWQRDGWQATLEDGTELPILRANAGLSAIVAPAGQHTISLSYQPLDVWIGLALSLLSLVGAIAVAWFWRPVIGTVPARSPKETSVSAAPEGETATYAKARITETYWRLALVVLLLLGFGLRVHLLGNQELRGDEAFSYLVARLPLNEIVPELLQQGDPHPPLHYLTLGGWMRLVGESEFALRYLSALTGTLLLSVLGVLGRRMAGRKTGLFAAGLAALSPGLIWLAQDVRSQYTFVPLFAALATAVLVTIPPQQKGRRVLYWLLYAALAALTVYQHYYGIFALLSHGLYLWFAPNRKRDLPAWIVSGGAVLLVLLPWLLASSTGLLGAGHLSDPSQPELARHLTTVGSELLTGQSLPAAIARWLFLGGAFIAGYGGYRLLRRRETTGWGAMLVGWLAIAVLGTYLVRFSRGTFNAYYISVAAPAWWLLTAAGLAALWQGHKWQRIVAVAAPAILLVAMITGLHNLYTNPDYSRTLGYREVAARLADDAGPNDLFIDHFPDPVWDYYLRDVAIERSLQPAKPDTNPAETEAALNDLAAGHDRLWFVPYIGSVWDPDNVVGRWLDYNLVTEEHRIYDRHQLDVYRSPDNAGAIMTPVGQQAGDIRLDSFYLTVNGRPVDPDEIVNMPRGMEVAVTLLWETQAAPSRDYSVFIHLLDENGVLIAQHDGTPRDGSRPTTTWQPGERLLDRHTLTVPLDAAGSGRLVVGLYDSETVERLIFDNGADTLTLAEAQFEMVDITP